MVREQFYGYAPNNVDPRDFHPDYEVNTDAEIAAWKTAVERVNQLGAWIQPRPNYGTGEGEMLYSGSEWGYGTYWVDMPEDEDEEPAWEWDEP